MNSPQLWWLTVGVRLAARAEATAPMLTPAWSNRMPVGQLRYTRVVQIMTGTASQPMMTKNHGW